MSKLMITCKEATEMVVQRDIERPGMWNRMRLWMHLAICRFCALFARQNKMINEAFKNLDDSTSFSMRSAAKTRILQELQK